MTKLSIVIPALNEEDGIVDIMERVLGTRAALAEVGVAELELIVVDDGSSDKTPNLVEAQEGARLIRHSANRGYGAALKTGYAAAQGPLIGFLDADGTYPPEYFPQLCQVALQEDADIVIGSRMAGSESQMPLVRRVGNVIFANLVSLISAKRITDSASGMRVFKKSILPLIYPLPDGLNLTPVMSTRALHEDLLMLEVPIPYSERAGRSKLSVVNDGIRFAQSIVWTALSYNPVQTLGLISLTMLVLAGIIALAVVLFRVQGVNYVGAFGAFALFSALIFAVAGVSILALGISFNYFVALFHHSPVRQGLFGRPIVPGLERQFGWIGLLSFLIGMTIGFAALVFGIGGTAVSRIWFYYLISAGFTLVGIQLIITWVQIQVLEALSLREQLIQDDMKEEVGNEREVDVKTGIEIGAGVA